MQNIMLELEVIQISIYSSIIKQMVRKHRNISISKAMVFAYLIKKDKFMLNKVYTSQNKQNVVCKAISLLAGEYDEYCESVKYILKAIHLLIEAGEITLNNELLVINENIKIGEVIYKENTFLEKAINLSKIMSDRQFMKEVISNV